MLNVFCMPGQTCILCVIVSFSWDICETFTASKCNISCMQCVLTSHVTLQNTGPRCVRSCCNLPRPIKNISRLALYPCLTNLIKHCSVAQWPGPPRTHAQWISIVIGPDGCVSRNTWYTVVCGGRSTRHGLLSCRARILTRRHCVHFQLCVERERWSKWQLDNVVL